MPPGSASGAGTAVRGSSGEDPVVADADQEWGGSGGAVDGWRDGVVAGIDEERRGGGTRLELQATHQS